MPIVCAANKTIYCYIDTRCSFLHCASSHPVDRIRSLPPPLRGILTTYTFCEHMLAIPQNACYDVCITNIVPKRPAKNIDKRIHESIRLRIMVQLIAQGHRLRFTQLKYHLGVTQGNLAFHLRVLQEAGLVTVSKSEARADSAPSVRVTDAGREAFVAYLEALDDLLDALKG